MLRSSSTPQASPCMVEELLKTLWLKQRQLRAQRLAIACAGSVLEGWKEGHLPG